MAAMGTLAGSESRCNICLAPLEFLFSSPRPTCYYRYHQAATLASCKLISKEALPCFDRATNDNLGHHAFVQPPRVRRRRRRRVQPLLSTERLRGNDPGHGSPGSYSACCCGSSFMSSTSQCHRAFLHCLLYTQMRLASSPWAYLKIVAARSAK